jgi:hypothetical protein
MSDLNQNINREDNNQNEDSNNDHNYRYYIEEGVRKICLNLLPYVKKIFSIPQQDTPTNQINFNNNFYNKNNIQSIIFTDDNNHYHFKISVDSRYDIIDSQCKLNYIKYNIEILDIIDYITVNNYEDYIKLLLGTWGEYKFAINNIDDEIKNNYMSFVDENNDTNCFTYRYKNSIGKIKLDDKMNILRHDIYNNTINYTFTDINIVEYGASKAIDCYYYICPQGYNHLYDEDSDKNKCYHSMYLHYDEDESYTVSILTCKEINDEHRIGQSFDECFYDGVISPEEVFDNYDSSGIRKTSEELIYFGISAAYVKLKKMLK